MEAEQIFEFWSFLAIFASYLYDYSRKCRYCCNSDTAGEG